MENQEQEKKEKPKIKNYQGLNSFHLAASNGQVGVVQLMLTHELYPLLINMKSEQAVLTVEIGDTPLHVAVRKNHEQITKLFIDAGANLGIRNEKGQTPLQLATHAEIKALIVNALHERWYAFMESFHPRLGAESPISQLPSEVVKRILMPKYASAIKEIDKDSSE
eukprot:c22399_g1_i1.p1 GENE.c22399_g1_i1~~c22399_g1_i1.p1  ORF type:complete len:180 (+),score=72.90 c22399_g1_i1:45-542(+)